MCLYTRAILLQRSRHNRRNLPPPSLVSKRMASTSMLGCRASNDMLCWVRGWLWGASEHSAGVRKQSLPREAVCYFGTMDICNVFSIKFGAGQCLFIGFDYTTLSQVRERGVCGGGN